MKLLQLIVVFGLYPTRKSHININSLFIKGVVKGVGVRPKHVTVYFA